MKLGMPDADHLNVSWSSNLHVYYCYANFHGFEMSWNYHNGLYISSHPPALNKSTPNILTLHQLGLAAITKTRVALLFDHFLHWLKTWHLELQPAQYYPSTAWKSYPVRKTISRLASPFSIRDILVIS